MKKIKTFFKDLLYSIVDTKYLFKFHKYNWATPLVVLFITVAIMLVPILIVYSTLSIDDITTNVVHLEKAIANTLISDYDCSINGDKLTCAEPYTYYDYSYTDDKGITTTYRVYVNTSLEGINFNVEGYDTVAPTDNFIVFTEEVFQFRYTYRDPINKQVHQYKLECSYENLNGVSFKDIKQNYLSKANDTEAQTYIIQEAENFILEGYKAMAKEKIFVTLTTDIGAYLLFIVVASILIKGTYLLKRNKGFTLSQSMKITFVASIQSLIIATSGMFMGLDFVNVLSLTIFVRILYIYIKYTGSRKNTQWIDDLYKEYKDERFNV